MKKNKNNLEEDILKVIPEKKKEEKEIERLKRNCNLKELENKELVKKVARQDLEIFSLKKREATLTALEKSLPQRIKTYKKKNAPKEVIQELQFISDMLMLEKEKILNKEVENETKED